MEYKLLNKQRINGRLLRDSVKVNGNVVCHMQTEVKDGLVFMRMKKRIFASDF